MDAIARRIPMGFEHPEEAAAIIRLSAPRRGAAGRRLSEALMVKGKPAGYVEVRYPEKEKFKREAAPLFTLEESSLLKAVAGKLSMMMEKKETDERKTELEAQLKHADRLAKIGQLAAGIAHELNNPLGDILGFAQLSSNCPDLPEQVYLDLEKIISSSLYAREIVKKLMLFTRQMPPKKTDLNLNRLVEEWLHLLETRCEKGAVEVVTRLEEGLPRVTGDPTQLNQVIVNIALNAIQAMPDGGTLRVETLSRGDWIHLVFKDTGMGMKEEIRRQIFIPFFTTKEVNHGTGLGLSVVHGIINTHGGAVDVESREGEGSSFTIRFPLQQENDEEQHV